MPPAGYCNQFKEYVSTPMPDFWTCLKFLGRGRNISDSSMNPVQNFKCFGGGPEFDFHVFVEIFGGGVVTSMLPVQRFEIFGCA